MFPQSHQIYGQTWLYSDLEHTQAANLAVLRNASLEMRPRCVSAGEGDV